MASKLAENLLKYLNSPCSFRNLLKFSKFDLLMILLILNFFKNYFFRSKC